MLLCSTRPLHRLKQACPHAQEKMCIYITNSFFFRLFLPCPNETPEDHKHKHHSSDYITQISKVAEMKKKNMNEKMRR